MSGSVRECRWQPVHRSDDAITSYRFAAAPVQVLVMQPINVSFRFEDNGRFHDDLLLQLGDRQWRCDSYYLLIDDGRLPGQEGASKVHAVLRRLLDQWCTAVRELSEGETCFLPFDFSDEYTRWLRCRAEGTTLRIQPGLAAVNGYSFWPSDVGELLKRLPDFKSEGDEVITSREEFLRTICDRTQST